MFEAAREAGGAVWLMAGAGALAAALVCAGCAGFAWDALGRDAWERAFPEPDPLADLADVTGTGVDLLAVHRELLPGWVLRAGQGTPDPEGLAALSAAVAGDPGLAAAVTRMAADLQDPVANADDWIAAVDVWNRRLDQLHAPWHTHAVVVSDADGAQAYLKAYHALYEGRSGGLRLRLLTRVDHLNVVEGYLGQTSDPQIGALVVVDRVAEHAVDELWPLLDPASPDPQAGPVVAELRAALPPDALAALEAAAPARAALMTAVAGVRERQGCGSRFRVQVVPFDGFAEDDLAAMSELAWADQGERCPSLTRDEARIFEESSAALQASDLRPAVEALLAWAARPTALHELQHAADALAYGSPDAVALTADGPPELGPGEIAELSAYLGSFSQEGASAAAWWQACRVEIGGYGSHALAMAAITAELAPDGCAGPVPDALPARAQALAQRWLGRTRSPALPADWPARLRLPEG